HRRVSTGAFHYEDVDLLSGKNRGLRDCLIIKVNVAGVKQCAPFSANENSSGTENVSRLKKFEGDRVIVGTRRAVSRNRVSLTQCARLPAIDGAIGFAVRKQRIQGGARLLALPRHYINGIVQQKAADFGRRPGHEDARLRLA